MFVTRTFGCWTAAALLACSLALPAAADGLSRFEEAIKQAPPGSFAYKSGKSLGDSGFALEGVTVTPPPDATGGAKAEPIAINRISVEDFDFGAVDKNAPPNFVKMRIEGTSNIHDWQVEGSIIGGYLEVGPEFPVEPGQAATAGKVEAHGEAYIPVRSLFSIEGIQAVAV